MPDDGIAATGGPLQWALMAVALAGASPPVIALLWVVWDRVRPLFIPQSEIDRIARACLAHYGEDAIEKLAIDADRAERRGDCQISGCLVRVIKAVARLEAEPDSNATRQLLH
jgi:hypothetical protein